MRNIIIGSLSLIFLGLVSLENWSLFSSATTEENLQNLDFLTCAFLFVVSLYLFASASSQSNIKARSVKSEADTAQKNSTGNSQSELNSGLVLYFLSLLQEKGRLLDFVMDDIAPYSDEQVGRVARVVHQGVRDVLDDTMNIEPVHSGQEGDTVSVGKDFNALNCRLVGDNSVQPPCSGKVLHRGWKAKKISLPVSVSEAVANADVVQPMELEVA